MDKKIKRVVNELLTYYDVIFMEDLNVSGMLKNHKLVKAIQEVRKIDILRFLHTVIHIYQD